MRKKRCNFGVQWHLASVINSKCCPLVLFHFFLKASVENTLNFRVSNQKRSERSSKGQSLPLLSLWLILR